MLWFRFDRPFQRHCFAINFRNSHPDLRISSKKNPSDGIQNLPDKNWASLRWSFCWNFKRTIAQIEKPHSRGKLGCWLCHWTSQIDLFFSDWWCQGRASCAGSIADDTSHSLGSVSFFYFQIVAKRADGAQAECVELFARQATDKCTLVLVEKSAEFSCVALQKQSLRLRSKVASKPDWNGRGKLGHCLAVPVQTIKTLLHGRVGEEQGELLFRFLSLDQRLYVDLQPRPYPSTGYAGLGGAYTHGGQRYRSIFSGPEKASAVLTINEKTVFLKAYLWVPNNKAVCGGWWSLGKPIEVLQNWNSLKARGKWSEGGWWFSMKSYTNGLRIHFPW